MKITTSHGSVLLPADIEKRSEYQLVEHTADALASTVLVAPHHGSKTSSTDEFVSRVNPRLVIFTAGYRNRFGHPNAEVVERYRSIGSRVLRSDADGAVSLRFANSEVVARGHAHAKSPLLAQYSAITARVVPGFIAESFEKTFRFAVQ